MGLLTGRNGVPVMNESEINLFCARTAELLASNTCNMARNACNTAERDYRAAKRDHKATRRLYAAYVAAKARLCVAEVRYGGGSC